MIDRVIGFEDAVRKLAWHSYSAALASVDLSAGATHVWSEIEPPAALASAAADNAASYAAKIEQSPRVKLASTHASENSEHATAGQNIKDTAQGLAASRSSYGGAPGGTVRLDKAMLKGVSTLADEFTIAISEFCGGSHNSNSRHYAGCAVDITEINGLHVSASNPYVAAFRQRCHELGATEVLGPGDKGHSTHIHAGWPRP